MTDLLLWNASGKGLKSNAAELTQFVQKNKTQIAIFTETHIKRTTSPPHAKPPHLNGMTATHTPHTNSSSGVAVYIDSSLHAVQLDDLSLYHPFVASNGNQTAVITHTMFVTRLGSPKQLVVSALYLPPQTTCNAAAVTIASLRRVVAFAKQFKFELIVAGDLNIEDRRLGGRTNRGPKVLREFFSKHFKSANRTYTPLHPTHIRGQSRSIIDHLLTLDAASVTGMSIRSTDDPRNGPAIELHAHRMLMAAIPAITTNLLHCAPPQQTRRKLHLPPSETHRYTDLLETALGFWPSRLHHNPPSNQREIDELTTAVTNAIERTCTTINPPKPPRQRRDTLRLTPSLKAAINNRKKAIAAIYRHKDLHPHKTTPLHLQQRKSAADKRRNAEVMIAKAQRWERRCGNRNKRLSDWQNELESIRKDDGRTTETPTDGDPQNDGGWHETSSIA
jgi:hypothetical protein